MKPSVIAQKNLKDESVKKLNVQKKNAITMDCANFLINLLNVLVILAMMELFANL